MLEMLIVGGTCKKNPFPFYVCGVLGIFVAPQEGFDFSLIGTLG
jgi:hypothetical protein